MSCGGEPFWARRKVEQWEQLKFNLSFLKETLKENGELHCEYCGKKDLIIYEPLILEDDYMGFRVIKDINRFKTEADLIVSSRKSDQINDVSDKLYSRDLFRQD